MIDTATADAQNLCLLGDRQTVLTVDHRFALNKPAFAERSFQKIVLQRQLSEGTACPLSGRNSTYRLVQILEAGSHGQ